MDSTNIIIPFDFPFAILEHYDTLDPNHKLVYAVADGQYTYGPLSLYQYHNDEKYSKTIRDEELPTSLPCKEFHIIDSDSIDDAIEIIDENRGRIYVQEINYEPPQIHMKELMKEMTECKDEIRSLKSIVLSEDRFSRRSSSNRNKSKLIHVDGNNRSLNLGPDDNNLSSPVRNKKTSDIRKLQQVQSTIVQRSVSINANTPPRSKTITTNRVLLKDVKSSGYGQNQSPIITTPRRSFRK